MDAFPQHSPPVEPDAWAELASALIHHRQTLLPKRLFEPGPTEAQLEAIFQAAAAAPDHGELVPWRFVLIPTAARGRLAQVFADALIERDPAAAPEQVAQAREKAFRAPVLMLTVVRSAAPGDDVPTVERLLSAGCALQNMLLMATAMGFGSSLTSGKALQAPGLRTLFALDESEQAVCFVSFGTADRRKRPRQRPLPGQYVSTLLPLP